MRKNNGMQTFAADSPAAERALLREGALNLLYPRRCPFCNEVLGTVPQCAFCAPRLAALRLKSARLAPQTHYFGDLDGAAAVFRYEDIVREAVLRIKYQGCRWYGRELGNCMAQALFGCTFGQKYGILIPKRPAAEITDCDVIVPVPKSNAARGYNVPSLLAQPLAYALQRPVLEGALRRSRFTKHQAGLPLEERLANVAGAFTAQSGCGVEGLRILLVDDVITTGATAAACTQALRKAGAESVFAAALASSQWQGEAPDEQMLRQLK